MQDVLVRWADARDLEGIPVSGGDGLLVPFEGETGAWTTSVSTSHGWVVLVAMTELTADPPHLDGLLRYAALVNGLELVGTLTVDVHDGAVGTRVSAPLPPDGDPSSTLDAAWAASVDATDRWIPGARDVASGIDPSTAFQRVMRMAGGVR